MKQDEFIIWLRGYLTEIKSTAESSIIKVISLKELEQIFDTIISKAKELGITEKVIERIIERIVEKEVQYYIPSSPYPTQPTIIMYGCTVCDYKPIDTINTKLSSSDNHTDFNDK